MRILLVKPRARLGTVLGLERFQRLEPLELGYLAAVAAPRHTVRILDLRLGRRPEHAFLAALAAFRPDLVGLTAYSHEAGEVKRLAARVRSAAPAARVVVGGHHATVAPFDLDLRQIDYIVRGEGCGPFRTLLDALDSGSEPSLGPELLAAGAGFDAAAAAVWPRYPDPASLPLPRRDLWDPANYFCVWVSESPRRWQRLLPRVAMARTSYGCRMKCSFCVVPYLCGGEHRPRPVEAVVEEIARLPQDHVYFADDENFIDESYAWELAEGLARRGVRKRYFAWTRATTVLRSPELLRRWREVGLDGAFLGFEFPTDEELRDARKGGTVALNERAHTTLRSLGVACHAAFMVRPEYGEEEFARLRAYVMAMPPAQFSFTVCTPSPATPDYEAARPDIWVDDASRLHDCMHPLTPTRLPLRTFGERLAQQLREASARNPLRVERHPVRPWELARVLRAEALYVGAFRRLYRDYPRQLWGWPGTSPAPRAAAG